MKDKELSHLNDLLVSESEFKSLTEIRSEKSVKVYTAYYNNEKVLIRLFSSPYLFKKDTDAMTYLKSDYITQLKYVTLHKTIFDGHMYSSVISHPGNLLSDLFDEKPLPWSKRYQVALGVARGLNFLHGKDRIYHYLRPYNILLDSQNQVRLTGFSGAEETDSFSGTDPYDSHSYGKDFGLPAQDIYSFGILLLALILWEKNPPAIKFGGKLSKDQVLLLKSAPSKFFKLIEKCTSSRLQHRPTAQQLIEALEHIIKEESAVRSTLYAFFMEKNTFMPNSLINEISEYANLT